MGTAARKHPFSDLSDTDLAEYERRVRAMPTLADVMRKVESFTRTEHELSGPAAGRGELRECHHLGRGRPLNCGAEPVKGSDFERALALLHHTATLSRSNIAFCISRWFARGK